MRRLAPGCLCAKSDTSRTASSTINQVWPLNTWPEVEVVGRPVVVYWASRDMSITHDVRWIRMGPSKKDKSLDNGRHFEFLRVSPDPRRACGGKHWSTGISTPSSLEGRGGLRFKGSLRRDE